jgi:hypothetical protein
MNLKPGSLSRLFVCHSRRAGFFELWPTIGFLTIASLKWSTTAAIEKMPVSATLVASVEPDRRRAALDSAVHLLLGQTAEVREPASRIEGDLRAVAHVDPSLRTD